VRAVVLVPMRAKRSSALLVARHGAAICTPTLGSALALRAIEPR
jgi:hypothetical protein